MCAKHAGSIAISQICKGAAAMQVHYHISVLICKHACVHVYQCAKLHLNIISCSNGACDLIHTVIPSVHDDQSEVEN